MADSKHVTLVAATVSTVNLDAMYYSQIEIVNRGDVEAFATDNDSTPTVEGEDTIVVPPKSFVLLNWKGDTTPTIKLISTGTPKISVEGL